MEHTNSGLKVQPRSSEPYFGTPEARIQIVIYGDYEDDKTRTAFTEIEKLLNLYPDDTWVIWRHFPLTNIHQKALKAAELAVAAHEKGKFREIHKLLLGNPGQLGLSSLIGYAREVEIYDTALYNALTNNKYAWNVRDIMSKGAESGVKSLPAVFINGQQFTGTPTFANLRKQAEKLMS